uniref:RING-type domain-containing protein n=1 Tax=Oryzias melastigma TaxID=30732 RepID=A0A3B3CRN3_ORYME
MAEEVESPLCSLEEELTCSICLSPFDCPVTIPCGHNFCQDCLLASWEDCSYSCPQCRTMFPIRSFHSPSRPDHHSSHLVTEGLSFLGSIFGFSRPCSSINV